MNKHKLSFVAAAACAVAPMLLTADVKANVVYQETFGYDNGGTAAGQLGYSSYDWDAQAFPSGSTTPASIATNTATTDGAISLGGPNGNHAGGAGTVIGTPSQTSTAGPVFLSGAGTTATALTHGVAYNNSNDGTAFDYTKEYGTYASGDVLNTTVHPGLTFSWFEGNIDATAGYSLAVKVGGQWYVTSTVYHSPATATTANFETGATEFNVPYTNTLTFNKLNFNGDYSFTANALGTGTTETLATTLARDTVDGTFTLDTTAPIQAFGMFSDANSAIAGNRRFDSFTITDSLTPEPASLAMIGLASGGLISRRRRAR